MHEEEAIFRGANHVRIGAGIDRRNDRGDLSKAGVSQQTFYRGKKKFGAMGLTEIRRLKQLEEENSKLKMLVADLSLDKAILQDVLRKKV